MLPVLFCKIPRAEQLLVEIERDPEQLGAHEAMGASPKTNRLLEAQIELRQHLP
jgi:hypothetical protein